jgi:hypothetical protein
VTNACPLTQFLRENTPTPMEDEALKLHFNNQISSSNYTNPSNFRLDQTIFNIL